MNFPEAILVLPDAGERTMSRSKTILLPLAFILLASAIGFASWSPQIPYADPSTCAVYRDFYNQLHDKKAVFIYGTSQRIPAEWVERAALPPSSFRKPLAEIDELDVAALLDLLNQPAATPEELQLDTASFFAPVVEGKQNRIDRCSIGNNLAFPIYNGSFESLHARERWKNRDNEGFVSMWSVSPVGFSDDGKFAVIYAELNCGGWCGWGGIILLEYKGNVWMVTGEKWLWSA